MTGNVTGTRSIVVERDLLHPPQKVWRALTSGALLEDWLMANDFQATVGHRFTFRTAPQPHWDGVVEGEVLEVAPQERLAYSWNAAGGLSTTITWTLTPIAEGTRLRMEQAGFRAEEEANYRGAAYGWQRNLDGLARVLAALD
jgi:uncharacterized protein YndB with AHSA1/START domain